jgi:hypothetical protein
MLKSRNAILYVQTAIALELVIGMLYCEIWTTHGSISSSNNLNNYNECS